MKFLPDVEARLNKEEKKVSAGKRRGKQEERK